MCRLIKTLIFFSICLVFNSCAIKAQEVVTRKTIEGSKAERLYKRGKQYLMAREGAKALADFQKATKLEPKFIDAYVQIGAYHYQKGDFVNAEKNFDKAISLDPNFDSNLYYSTAIAKMSQNKFKEAISSFEAFLNSDSDKEKLRTKASDKIATCKFKMENDGKFVPFEPVSVGDGINTTDLEYLPSLTADEETMVITRRLRGQEDFYVSEKINGKWSKAFPIKSINRPDLNEGAQSLSHDGKMLFYAVDDEKISRNGFDIYFAEVVNGSWTKAKSLGAPVNGPAWDSQPCISADKKNLYFTSKRKGGKGGSDLYLSIRNDDGSWQKPINLGDKINTSGDEAGPFIHPDNQTLYFMSDGHPGFGSQDIFYSRRQADGSWGEPKNLGYPINTSGHEGSFIVSANGRTAYYATERLNKDKNNNKHDIYSFDLYEEARPQPVTYVKAKIVDAVTKQTLSANLDITDLMGQQSYYKESVDEQGIFLVPLPIGKQYALNVNKTGYLFHSENFALENVNTSIDPFLMIIELQKIPPAEVINSTPKEEMVSAPIVLKNVFFETASADLKSISKIELDQLYILLSDQPNLRIQLNGHTDNVGRDEDNMALSEARAKAVYEYLVSKGISSNRMRSKGFGETVPVASNDNEEGRRQNRRTEFQLIN